MTSSRGEMNASPRGKRISRALLLTAIASLIVLRTDIVRSWNKPADDGVAISLSRGAARARSFCLRCRARSHLGLEQETPAGRHTTPSLATDTPPYGVGLFLLAGSEVVKLAGQL
jgi:hypothetical protein